MSKLKDKTHENSRQAFNNFLEENHEEESKENAIKNVSDVQENFITDNGVKSAVFLGRLDSQKERQEQSIGGATSIINLTTEELQDWHQGKMPEGWKFTGAGGAVFSGGTKKYSEELGIYYADGAEHDYQFGVFYDENSSEDNPVVYLRKTEASTYSELDTTETLKIEINKVDPSNATYEEMIALAGYIYRDDELAASEASDAVTMAREYMEIDGLEWQAGSHDYTGYYLSEVVRRNIDYPNPSNKRLAEAAENLLEYLKDYPRGSN